jgi:hypothetical protein
MMSASEVRRQGAMELRVPRRTRSIESETVRHPPNLLTTGESRITNAGMGPNESYGNAQSPPVFKCVRVGLP